jgi:hypothetical protein
MYCKGLFWKAANSDRKIVESGRKEKNVLKKIEKEKIRSQRHSWLIFLEKIFFGNWRSGCAEECVCVCVCVCVCILCLCLLVYVSGGNFGTGTSWNHGNGHAKSQGHCKATLVA